VPEAQPNVSLTQFNNPNPTYNVDSLYLDARHESAFWNDAPLAKALLDPQGRFVKINASAWTRLLRYTEGELIGTSIADITHPGDLRINQAEMARQRERPNTNGYAMVQRFLSKTNSTVWVELHVYPIRKPAGELEEFAVTIIPLPNFDHFKVQETDDGYAVRPRLRWLDIVRDNPRESLVVALALMIGFKLLPIESFLDMLRILILK
jgi:PAS domain S-box-containing protein